MKQLRDYQQQAVYETWQALKESDDPVCLYASVGAGKSLMLADILLTIQKANKRALCLVNNSELVRSNCQAFNEQGGQGSIYCAALNEKNCKAPVVFATPQTVLNGINKHKNISKIQFNLIIVDEAHSINFKNEQSTFMQILRFYKQNYPAMRLLGATGTPFRYKGDPIEGKNCLFKSKVGNITTSWLISEGYLVKPIYEVDRELTIDFSTVKIDSTGKFNNKELEKTVNKNIRLTGKILLNLQDIMKTRKGCFIFCCTKRHCIEAASVLPSHETAIITADTKNRTEILNKARAGKIKYLININVLTTGIDVPSFDTLLFLRPTESLVLTVQMMGRVLRLHPDKQSALILDCAGNIERHSDWDDPLIIDALAQTRDKEQRLIFPCPTCDTMNSEHARRCIGLVNDKRCDFYFEWKDCAQCHGKNDLVSRYCRHCEAELIDPNTKLKAIDFEAPTITVKVLGYKYWVQESGRFTQFRATYQYEHHGGKFLAHECWTPTSSDKAKNVFYGQFVSKHTDDPSFWYHHLTKSVYLNALIKHARTPDELILKYNGKAWVIQKKIFHESVNDK